MEIMVTAHQLQVLTKKIVSFLVLTKIKMKFFLNNLNKKTKMTTKKNKKLQHQKKLEVNHQRQNLVNMRVRTHFSLFIKN